MEDIIVGIDLGTTNSEVAILKGGRPEILPDGEERPMLPSVVGLGDDGRVMVGHPARNQALVYPERTISSVKRRMGQDSREPMGEDSYSPPEVSAMILQQLKLQAEAQLGQPVHKAVITVPAYFSDAQRQATREAGTIAGLEVVRILNEPTAAALTYNADHQGSKTLLVYDLGGGTFDVSVVQIEDGVVEVVSSHGNNHLGGDDFDNKIIAWIGEKLLAEHGFDATADARVRSRINRAAETAKKALSDNPFARIEEEFLGEKDGDPVHLSLELSREDYEQMIMPFIDETMEAIHTALSGAGRTASEVEEILLVGGSSRTPLVSRRLEEEFGQAPRSEVHPDLCVAMGAAIQAAAIAGESVSAVLVDVTPYTFGTSSLGEMDGMLSPHVYVPIIAKNTAVPVTKSEVFFTTVDGQRKVRFEVFQGEHPDARRNILLGDFMVEGLRGAPENDPILATFQLDVNGLLTVTAQEKVTGLEKSITIENALSRLEGQALDQARSRLHTLFGLAESEEQEDEDESQARHAIVKAKALVEKAQGLLEKVEADDRDEMVALIENIHEALAADDPAALAEPVEQLADILFYLET